MPRVSTAAVLRHLARTDTTTLDRDLLARFVAERDGSAFAELVRRHGPMVLAACRRGTRHRHDADDAFQAVFLSSDGLRQSRTLTY
jgi:DNA-directed RNA polymerase specialized sigma24 family protein